MNKVIRKVKLISKNVLYSMKIKKQTRKLAAGCSKHRFEVVDRTDEVSNHTYGKAKLTWFKFDFRRVLDSLSYYSRLNPLYYKNGEIINFPLQILYSMKIKEQTRKLAAGCSKHRFEVVDRTDEVSNTYTAR